MDATVKTIQKNPKIPLRSFTVICLTLNAATHNATNVVCIQEVQGLICSAKEVEPKETSLCPVTVPYDGETNTFTFLTVRKKYNVIIIHAVRM